MAKLVLFPACATGRQWKWNNMYYYIKAELLSIWIEGVVNYKVPNAAHQCDDSCIADTCLLPSSVDRRPVLTAVQCWQPSSVNRQSVLTAVQCWPPSSVEHHPVLTTVQCWPPSSVDRQPVLTAIQCWPPTSVDRHPMLTAVQCWPPSSVDRHPVLTAVQCWPPSSVDRCGCWTQAVRGGCWPDCERARLRWTIHRATSLPTGHIPSTSTSRLKDCKVRALRSEWCMASLVTGVKLPC